MDRASRRHRPLLDGTVPIAVPRAPGRPCQNTPYDPDLARGVVTERREVVQRIDLVQGLLFSASSKRITAAVAKVENANAALAAALNSITDLTTVIRHMTAFLTSVDNAINLAKVL